MGDAFDAEAGVVGQQMSRDLQPDGVDVFDRRDGESFLEIFDKIIGVQVDQIGQRVQADFGADVPPDVIVHPVGEIVFVGGKYLVNIGPFQKQLEDDQQSGLLRQYIERVGRHVRCDQLIERRNDLMARNRAFGRFFMINKLQSMRENEVEMRPVLAERLFGILAVGVRRIGGNQVQLPRLRNEHVVVEDQDAFPFEKIIKLVVGVHDVLFSPVGSAHIHAADQIFDRNILEIMVHSDPPRTGQA